MKYPGPQTFVLFNNSLDLVLGLQITPSHELARDQRREGTLRRVHHLNDIFQLAIKLLNFPCLLLALYQVNMPVDVNVADSHRANHLNALV